MVFRFLCKLCLVVFKHFLFISNSHVCTAEWFSQFKAKMYETKSLFSDIYRLTIERVISNFVVFK